LEATPLGPSLRDTPNVDILEKVQVREVIGEAFVDAVAVALPGGELREIPVKGVFVKLPRTPNSSLVRGWIDLDECGCILVDVDCATSAPGVFAAGDVTHVSEQVLVHIGEGAKAAISASHYLLEHCP
jgi:alkyl hydroperoxide reductase subunit F